VQSLGQPWAAGYEFRCSIDNDLWSVCGVKSKSTYVVGLSFGDQHRRVRVFPPVMVPVVHVFAENDQMCAWNRLRRVHAFQQCIGWRTAVATLRSEQFNENRLSGSIIGSLLMSTQPTGQHHCGQNQNRQDTFLLSVD